MPINKEFDAAHRDMVELIAAKDKAESWDGPEQRMAADMVVRTLWSLARCKVPPPVMMAFLKENLDKL